MPTSKSIPRGELEGWRRWAAVSSSCWSNRQFQAAASIQQGKKAGSLWCKMPSVRDQSTLCLQDYDKFTFSWITTSCKDRVCFTFSLKPTPGTLQARQRFLDWFEKYSSLLTYHSCLYYKYSCNPTEKFQDNVNRNAGRESWANATQQQTKKAG